MAKYNVERRGRAGESNKQGGFPLCVRGDRKRKKTALISCHTRVSAELDSNSHMVNVTVCFEIAPRILCSSLPSDIYHLCLTLLGVFKLQRVDAESLV